MSHQPPPSYAPIPGMPPPPPPDHPQAMTILVLGIVGHVLCGLTSPFAWYMGGKARREIAASNGTIGGSAMVTVGWVMGIVGCVQLLLAVLYVVFVVVVALAGSLSSAS